MTPTTDCYVPELAEGLHEPGIDVRRAGARALLAVGSMALCVAMLIASEFMPVSLLTPIAVDLGATEGTAGQAISISGLFAVAASFFIAPLAGRFDRRPLLMTLTAVMLASLLLIAQASNFYVFMAARALLGLTIGGFWALSTATVIRLVPAPSLPAALALLFTGNAVATAFAAPLGSYLGGLIGWRGVFLAMAPVVVLNLIWQWASLPSMPARTVSSSVNVLALLKRRHVALAMVALMLTFGGAFSAFTYFRPFLESRTHVTLEQLSMLLLGLGMAGFVGTYGATWLGARDPYRWLGRLPLMLGVVTVVMLVVGHVLWAVGLAMITWGAVNSAIPVTWSNWLAKAIQDAPESGGGLMVAATQTAIMLGAALGGVLLDHFSIAATLLCGALMLVGARLAVGDGKRLTPGE